MQYEKILSTLDEIKTFSDPFRLKILLAYGDKNEPMTVKQIAVKLDEVPAKVHYHVKELERIGILEIVETREKSGILEKYYLPTAENIRIDKNFSTSEGCSEELQEMGGMVLNTLLDEYGRFRKYTNKNARDAKMTMGTVYLTDEECEELDLIVTNYVNSKKYSEGAKAYVHGFLLFRKYDSPEGD
ncbi:MAG: hypothetical protein APF77_09225 [Clostridia bacterium BRH_c25]|nr:MAG: hypothetical protein APF77_09225 [Clostridia bacterium BRH_c25]